MELLLRPSSRNLLERNCVKLSIWSKFFYVIDLFLGCWFRQDDCVLNCEHASRRVLQRDGVCGSPWDGDNVAGFCWNGNKCYRITHNGIKLAGLPHEPGSICREKWEWVQFLLLARLWHSKQQLLTAVKMARNECVDCCFGQWSDSGTQLSKLEQLRLTYGSNVLKVTVGCYGHR